MLPPVPTVVPPVVVYSMKTLVRGSTQPARPRRAVVEPATVTELLVQVAVSDGCVGGRTQVPLAPMTIIFNAFALFENQMADEFCTTSSVMLDAVNSAAYDAAPAVVG